MSRRLGTFLIWFCVAASAVFWSLRLLADPLPVPESARLASAAAAPGGDWSRLLGAAARPVETVAAPPLAASRFRLVGVAAAGGPGQAVEVALIAVDGQPARAFRIGQAVADDWRLSAVDPRGATLSPVAAAGAALILEMPPPVAAATGVIGAMPAVPVLPTVSLPPPTPALQPPGSAAAMNAAAALPAEPPPAGPDLRNSPLAR